MGVRKLAIWKPDEREINPIRLPLTLDKTIKIEAGVDVAYALRVLANFVENYRETHVGFRHGVVYQPDEESGWFYVYQTDTLYVVRRA
jgi:hypothetical protein